MRACPRNNRPPVAHPPAGADPAATDGIGDTPYDVYCQTWTEGARTPISRSVSAKSFLPAGHTEPDHTRYHAWMTMFSHDDASVGGRLARLGARSSTYDRFVPVSAALTPKRRPATPLQHAQSFHSTDGVVQLADEPVVLSALSWVKLGGDRRSLVAQARLGPLSEVAPTTSPTPGDKRYRGAGGGGECVCGGRACVSARVWVACA